MTVIIRVMAAIAATDDPRVTPDRPGADEIGLRLLDAAAEVFAERGYEGAGVAEIARRAGVTTGAIYSRFTGKADLLAAALDAAHPRRARRAVRRPPLRGPRRGHPHRRR